MAHYNTPNFSEQIKESRKKIRDSFKRSHEALQVRENILLSHVDEIEKEYNSKTLEMNKLILEALKKVTLQCEETLAANKLTDVTEIVHSALDKKIQELTADTDTIIEFEWDNLFETGIQQLGSIKLNGQTMISPTSIFPPHVKPVVPDYKTKQLPTAYCCKSSKQKSKGELNDPRCLAIHYKTGNIYITDRDNHRVQVFSCNGDCLFMFSEKMNLLVGICISQNKVFVTQWNGHSISMYELEGKLIKSVGSEGNGEAQFKNPLGLDVSDRNNNIYVCDFNNHRIQILTKELKYHSMLGIDLLVYPRVVKVTRDRVLVLDQSDPCMFVFNSDHVLTNRLIARGDGKQTIHAVST